MTLATKPERQIKKWNQVSVSKTSETLSYLRVFFVVAAILHPRHPVRRRRQESHELSLQRLEKHHFIALGNMINNMFLEGNYPYIHELRGHPGHLHLQRFVLLLEALQLLLALSCGAPLEAQADSEAAAQTSSTVYVA